MLFAVANLLLAIGSAHAQSVTVVADIPFDFVVGKATLHAGRYTVQPISINGSIVLLRSADLQDEVVLVPCDCASDAKPVNDSKLVFKVAGNHYYLWQIWTQGYDVGRELPVKFRETDVADNNKQVPVVIAAYISR